MRESAFRFRPNSIPKTLWWKGLLVTFATFAFVPVRGTVVYPVIFKARGSSADRLLAITPNHLLQMEHASVFADVYTKRIIVNDTAMDLLVNSSILQENLYQCRQNTATYKISFGSDGVHVEGTVNTTHAIRPMKLSRGKQKAVPHKLFRIFGDHVGVNEDRKRVDDVNEVRTEKKIKKKSYAARRRGLPRQHPEARESTEEKGPRNKHFPIEVFLVVDSVLYKLFKCLSDMETYAAILINVVNLKFVWMELHSIGVVLVGVRALETTEMEEDIVVVKEGLLDADATLSNFRHYMVQDSLLSKADIAIFLTGRNAVSFKSGTKKELTGTSYLKDVCDPGYKVALVEDRGAVYMATTVIAHEIGHLLGARHDGPSNKEYPECPEYGAIMAPTIDENSGTFFSECSELGIRDYLLTMSDDDYDACITVANTNYERFLNEKRIVPPKITAEEYCAGTQGDAHYYAKFQDCKLYCYGGSYWNSYLNSAHPAPYGFRCGDGKICLYGQCVSCAMYSPQWEDCDNS